MRVEVLHILGHMWAVLETEKWIKLMENVVDFYFIYINFWFNIRLGCMWKKGLICMFL